MGIPPLPQPIRNGKFREGVGWMEGDLDDWICAGGLEWLPVDKTERPEQRHKTGNFVMADIEEAYARATDKISEAQTAYNKTIAGFRGTVKNDLASIAAAGEKVTTEAAKIQRQCQATADLMNSPEMFAAIQNAERLARALRAISELQSHSITFAVLDKKVGG